MIQREYVLTEEERQDLNSIDTPPEVRLRLYARSLRTTAEAYAVAADAPGLGKVAARFLMAEAARLTRESYGIMDYVDELERRA